jgi:splicing factor 3B subunit 3
VLYKFIKNESKIPTVIANFSINAESLVEFHPKPLSNLQELDRMPQIYLLSGSGARSTLRIIKQGLEVKELAAKKLGKPQALWTLKAQSTDKHDKYMVLSFTSQTAVLMFE